MHIAIICTQKCTLKKVFIKELFVITVLFHIQGMNDLLSLVNFFYHSIASFDMLLSGCNRAIMNLQYWSEREFRPFPWGKQSFFYLSVYLNFPYLWYLHPMMCCGGDFFQNLTDFFWCDNEERSSHLLINSSYT